jgi:PhzF family phenazine biosynthesis protein
MRYFHVDAFTDRPFGGNPAGVVPLDAWPDDAHLLAMAAEHKHSETAFFVRTPGGDADFHLRWFTPEVEVELCGHGTLSAAHVLRRHLGWSGDRVVFDSRSGALPVTFEGEEIVLDFPARASAEEAAQMPVVTPALRAAPDALLRSSYNLLAVFATEAHVRTLEPDMGAFRDVDTFGVIATAPGDASGVDFVSRYFAPKAGVLEDPVTGSAHCTLAPYWSQRLGKDELRARQVSRRGGELRCAMRGERVAIGGRAVTYLEGTIIAES